MPFIRAFQVTLVVRNLPARAGDVRDAASIPELERSLENGMATRSRVLAWRIPWTGDPGSYRSWGCKDLTAAT